MPRGDRTGPIGVGPLTGHRGGYCVGYNTSGYMNPGPGYGYGAGWGGGRGRGGRWRDWYYEPVAPRWPAYHSVPTWPVPPTKEQETESLRQQAEWLQEQLDGINQRLEELSQE